jgi:hypothetical protein
MVVAIQKTPKKKPPLKIKKNCSHNPILPPDNPEAAQLNFEE